MRIEFLKLRNYANIYTAMGKKEIEIHFPDNGKKVVLFVGENGTGKSSIMDQLHPFVENSTTRTVKDLLIPSDKEGHTLEAYKEIHIRKMNNLYVIKHHIDSKGRTKSFIYKNDMDLNPNGNVLPFKEVVENELSVTTDFLRLLSLGTNSKTFIKMSSTERKNFISELMTEVAFYNEAFKNASEETRILRRMLMNIANEQKKNEVDNGDEYLDRLQIDLKDGEENADRLLMDSTKSKTIIEQLAPKGVDILSSRVEFLKHRRQELSKELGKDVRNLADIERDIITLKNEKSTEDYKLQSLKDKRDTLMSDLDRHYNEIMSLESEVGRLSSEKDIEETEERLGSLYAMKDKFDSEYGGKTITITKDTIMDSLGLLREISDRVSEIYEFDSNAIKRVTLAYINKENIESELVEELEDIENEIRNVRIGDQVNRGKKSIEGRPTQIILKKSSCDCECPFEGFYQEVLGLKKPKSVSDEEHRLEREKLKIEEAMAVSGNIRLIKMTLDANHNMIKGLPYEYLGFSTILNNIYNETPLYDEKHITTYIKFIEVYEKYKEDIGSIEHLEKELSLLKKSDESTKYLHRSLTEKKKDAELIEHTLKEINVEFSTQSNIVGDMGTNLTNQEKLYDRTKYIQESIEEYERTSDEYAKLSSKLETALAESKSLERDRDLLNRQRHMNEKMKYSISQISRKIENFRELEEKRKTLSEDFDDAQHIRESLSSGKGIPLIYMNMYMAQILSDINEILDIVYGGRIEIPRFNIDANEFSIPYINNGAMIKDVSQCSQGEETFFSIAISFAFVSRAMQNEDSFNIPTLDEVDAALDAFKRDKFLDIIERQMEKIDAEQIFISSHNQAFDNYPVNVIELTKGLIDSYTNKTTIEVL